MVDDMPSVEGTLGQVHAPVVFSLQQEQGEKHSSLLHEEREKHRRRAERFGSQYVDPGRVRRDFGIMMEARKERQRANHGFTTGDLDLFSEEEVRKRAARAARFQLDAPLAPVLEAYKPDEELEARARRAAKFGVPYEPTEAVLMDMDLFEQRREVGSLVERRPEAVYLYGVDVMSTRDVLSYFSDYGPVFVEWLDDSSCNVLFGDANSAKRAMVGRGTPLPPQVVTEQQQQDPQSQQRDGAVVEAGSGTATGPPVVRYQPELPVPDNLADVANLPYVWHKGRDFVKDGTPVSLVYRMATAADVRDMSQPKRTRELWKAAGGGGGGGGGRGRGRGGQARTGGKRPFRRRGEGDGDGPTDMEVDDDGPGAGADGEGDDVPMKRQRGARGGQRLAYREMRPSLQPYGGSHLLMPGPGLLPATGHVLDYTELEDEGPAVAAAEGEGAVVAGEEGGHGRRGGRGGRQGGGRGGRAQVGDLREILKARRRAAAPPPPRREDEDNNDGEGVEDYGSGQGEEGGGCGQGGEEGAVGEVGEAAEVKGGEAAGGEREVGEMDD